jgi:hypothetical protein
MIIGAIEKIHCKEEYRDKQKIAEYLISDFYHMLGAEPPTDEHPDTESNCKRHIILPTHHDSDKAPNKPKYTHRRCKSLRHECRELDNKSIIEIIPHARTRDEEIPEDIETEESAIIEIFTPL